MKTIGSWLASVRRVWIPDGGCLAREKRKGLLVWR